MTKAFGATGVYPIIPNIPICHVTKTNTDMTPAILSLSHRTTGPIRACHDRLLTRYCTEMTS